MFTYTKVFAKNKHNIYEINLNVIFLNCLDCFNFLHKKILVFTKKSSFKFRKIYLFSFNFTFFCLYIMGTFLKTT